MTLTSSIIVLSLATKHSLYFHCFSSTTNGRFCAKNFHKHSMMAFYLMKTLIDMIFLVSFEFSYEPCGNHSNEWLNFSLQFLVASIYAVIVYALTSQPFELTRISIFVNIYVICDVNTDIVQSCFAAYRRIECKIKCSTRIHGASHRCAVRLARRLLDKFQFDSGIVSLDEFFQLCSLRLWRYAMSVNFFF